MSATELVCQLSDALEGGALEDGAILPLLHQLASLASQADPELEEVLMEAAPLLMRAAGLSPPADAAVRWVLSAAAQHCPAREVFTLCSAALAQQLSERDDEQVAAQLPGHGPASPAFQLFLLGLLHCCLPRIRRRPMHFLADVLQMQLRWAAEVLPALLLGELLEPAPAEEQASGSREAATAAAAVQVFVRLAGGTAAWVSGSAAGQQKQLTAAEQQVALGLLGLTGLQLASIVLQLPQNLKAGTAALAAAANGQGMAGGLPASAPAPGSRLPLMRAAAAAVLELPLMLLRAAPGKETSPAGSGPGSASSASQTSRDGTSSVPPPTPEQLEALATSTASLLAASGIDPDELSYFSEAEAREGAAVAACAAACGLLASSSDSGSGSGSSNSEGGGPTAAQQAQWLGQLLPRAACCLLDLGAQHQSAALTLLPLCALCTAGRQVASAASAGGLADGQQQAAADAASPAPSLLLAGSTAELNALLSALVGVMSFNPVQLLRSCAHDAVHAALDAFQSGARLAQLRAMMQMPSSAAAVVALQRLRQEMAAAWPNSPSPALPPGTGSSAASGSSSGQPGGSTSGQQGTNSCSDSSSTSSRQVWLMEEALGLALPCLERGTAAGWHDEGSVLAAADVQAAALSALRWVLLRQLGAAPGQQLVLLAPQRAARLLQSDLLPLQACLERAMERQADAAADSLYSGGAAGGSQAAALPGNEALHGLMAAQRLQEVLGSVLELLGQVAAVGQGVA